MGEICAENPSGIMVHRDELLSLFTDLDNPEKASARGFFLTGWGGLDGYTYDRIGRGTVRIPAANISIFGTTQPSRLAGYIRESIRRFDDGMVQRLQLLAWLDFTGTFQEVDRFPDSTARQAAHECFADLASLDLHELGAERDAFDGPTAIPYLRFAEDAQEAFSEWQAKLESDVRSDELAPHMVAHVSKYRGLIPRLALICHLANNATGPVSAKALVQAFGWGDYLRSHAHRAYASLSLDNAEAARAIWRKVSKGQLPQPFTARDIRQKGWSGLSDQGRIEAGLDALTDTFRLKPERVETGGRPSIVYRANPKALRGPG